MKLEQDLEALKAIFLSLGHETLDISIEIFPVEDCYPPELRCTLTHHDGGLQPLDEALWQHGWRITEQTLNVGSIQRGNTLSLKCTASAAADRAKRKNKCDLKYPRDFASGGLIKPDTKYFKGPWYDKCDLKFHNEISFKGEPSMKTSLFLTLPCRRADAKADRYAAFGPLTPVQAESVEQARTMAQATVSEDVAWRQAFADGLAEVKVQPFCG